MTTWRRVLSVLAVPGLLLAAHEAAARLLDHLAIVDRLLASGAVGRGPELLAMIVFYALRLALFFIVPGRLIVGLVQLVWKRPPPSARFDVSH